MRTAALALVSLTACGGSTESAEKFFGIYQTTSHVSAQGSGASIPCSDPGGEVLGPPAFKVAADAFFGDPYARLSECTDTTGVTCTETQVSMVPGGPGLEQEWANSQTGGGFDCQLYYTRYRATLTGTVIQIESLEKYDAPALSGSACSLEAAQGLADSTECQRIERWEGTLIAPI